MRIAPIVDRKIKSDEIRWLIVSGDNIDEIHFKVATFYEEIDLSAAVFRIRYISVRGVGDVEILDKLVLEDLITLIWRPKNWATAKSGELWIQIYAVLEDGRVWTSHREKIYVERSIDVEVTGEFTPQILEQYLTLYETKLDLAEKAALAASKSADDAEGFRDQAEQVLLSKATKSIPSRQGNLAALTAEGDLIDTGLRIGTTTVGGVDFMTIEI